MKKISYAILAIGSFAACKTTNPIVNSRVYYDYAKNMVSTDRAGTKPLKEPIQFQSGEQLNIDIYDFNPLREELSVADSASVHFLSDTASLTRAIGSFTTLSLAAPDEKATSAIVQQAPQKGQAPARPAAPPVISDCKLMGKIMTDINTQKQKVTDAIGVYKMFLSQIENINVCYKNLQQPRALTAAYVQQQLSDNFVSRINKFLSDRGMRAIPSSPAVVSSKDLDEIESQLYQNIQTERKTLDNIIKQADPLTGKGCDNFLEFYKEFVSKTGTLKDQLAAFDDDYTKKAYPAYQKTVGLFDQLRLFEDPLLTVKTPVLDKDEHFVKISKKITGQTDKIHVTDLVIDPIRGWKVDVAGGIFFNSLADDQFSIKTKDSIYTKAFVESGQVHDSIVQQTFTSINKQKQTNISYGAMVFLHAHTQSGTFINWGISLGFGALFNDQTRWLASLGPTLIIGKGQRFTINAGVTVSQVTRLSAPYKTGVWYAETIDNPPTFKATKVGLGLGFSWNFHK